MYLNHICRRSIVNLEPGRIEVAHGGNPLQLFGHPTVDASLSLWEKIALAWLHKQSPPLRTKEKLSV
ncbi:hypothetical protein [Nostoc sp.]|uniref:hypothetical protein n=1 Tax=Nostoc sp. TaxID=1180 RepID=UPI002FF9D488